MVQVASCDTPLRREQVLGAVPRCRDTGGEEGGRARRRFMRRQLKLCQRALLWQFFRANRKCFKHVANSTFIGFLRKTMAEYCRRSAPPSIQGIHEHLNLQQINCHLALLDSFESGRQRCTCTSRRKKSRYGVLHTFMFKLIWKHETTGRRLWRWMRHKSSEEAKATAKSTAMHQKKTIVIKADSENTNVMSIICNKTQKQT